MFVCGLVVVKDTKQHTVMAEDRESVSRRSMSFFYHLLVGTKRIPVCKAMFLNTFDLKDNTVRCWVLDYYNISKNNEQNQQSADRESSRELNINEAVQESGIQDQKGNREDEQAPVLPAGQSRKAMKLRWEHLNQFIDDIPKMESHYCRKSSSKLYLQTDINSMNQFRQLYVAKCEKDGYQPLSRNSFKKACNGKNVTIFIPRKDQCDLCSAHKTGNVKTPVYLIHRELKTRTRLEKAHDKQRGLNNEVHVICCDLMAVQMVPHLRASAAYYKLKIACHNYTVYNLATRDAKCYWFDEINSTLDASTYASCLVDYIEELLLKTKQEVIIYSDGCTSQNRNAVLANALLHLSVKHNVSIIQKYLEKGHTQMEGDSVHGKIERFMKNKEIYLPSQFCSITEQARRLPSPYRAEYLDHTFFSNYSLKESMVYSSIRPGNTKGDPQVTDLRWIQYQPCGRILYKVNYDDELEELPRRPLRPLKSGISYRFPKAYTQRRMIPIDKWRDLQDLKLMIPSDCHSFYDTLPHDEVSIRQKKMAEKKKNETIGK